MGLHRVGHDWSDLAAAAAAAACVKLLRGKLLNNKEPSLDLCDNPEGWDGGSGWRLRWEGIYIHIYTYMYVYIFMTDSNCCTIETNIKLQSNFPPIEKQIKIKKKKEVYLYVNTHVYSRFIGGQACRSKTRCWNSTSWWLASRSSVKRSQRFSSSSTSAKSTWKGNTDLKPMAKAPGLLSRKTQIGLFD